MAACCLKVVDVQEITDEFSSLTKKDVVDLSKVASFVKRNCNSNIPLKKPENCTLRICGQDETVYAGNKEQLEAWKDYYLAERMEMVVIGAIDYFPCDAFGLQLVLLLCEDGKVYAYEDEVLHLVANNVEDLLQCGMVFPGIETFKLGECFEDPTEEEYNEMMKSEEIKAIRASHQRFRDSLENKLLKILIKGTENEETVNKETVNEETENKETGNEETENKETGNEETENEETECNVGPVEMKLLTV